MRRKRQDVAGAFEPFLGKTSSLDCTEAGPDGIADLTFKFRRRQVTAAIRRALGRDPEKGEVLVLPLTGRLSEDAGGTLIRGEDVVVIVN